MEKNAISVPFMSPRRSRLGDIKGADRKGAHWLRLSRVMLKHNLHYARG